MDEFGVAVATICIIILLFLGGFVGGVMKEDDFVKHMKSGMTPYVSSMNKLEWKPN